MDIQRDRLARFEPQLVAELVARLVAKHQRRMPGFDDHVISMYARGMNARAIQGRLQEPYGLQASPDSISTITNEAPAEVEQRQQRSLLNRTARHALLTMIAFAHLLHLRLQSASQPGKRPAVNAPAPPSQPSLPARRQRHDCCALSHELRSLSSLRHHDTPTST